MYNQNPYAQNPYAPVPAPRRSAIPKVIGILMIIFGSLGILGALAGSIMPQDPMLKTLEGWNDIERVTNTMTYIGLPISAFQLFAGLVLVRYRPAAPKLAVVYGALSAIHTIGNVIVTYAVVMPAMRRLMEDAGGGSLGRGMGDAMSAGMSIGLILGTVIGLAWPTVVLVLMTRPAAKAACTNQL